MQVQQALEANLMTINGITIARPDEALDGDTLRQRACTELLRQAAQKAGLLDANDTPAMDGVQSEAASTAVEALLEQALDVPEPSEQACRRHHNAHQALYTTGERVNARHILFAVTPGVDMNALRKRAETALLDVRCHDDQHDEDTFARAAMTLSNCPSGSEGGQLGWLTSTDCAPEFAKEIFGSKEVGVLPRLVHSRFGLHVVEVLARDSGQAQPYEAVSEAVAQSLRQQAWITALRQTMRVLASRWDVQGVDLDAADSPLIQ